MTTRRLALKMIDFDSQKGDDAAGEGRSLTDEEIKVLVATPDARRGEHTLLCS